VAQGISELGDKILVLEVIVVETPSPQAWTHLASLSVPSCS
jgi:hypothetical protein